MHQKTALRRTTSMTTHDPILPEGLRTKTLARVRRIERARARVHLVVASATLFLSAYGVAWSVQSALVSLQHSGFYEYASLLTSDFNVVAAYGLEFALSIAESLPLVAITIGCTAFVSMLFSMRTLARASRSYRIALSA